MALPAHKNRKRLARIGVYLKKHDGRIISLTGDSFIIISCDRPFIESTPARIRKAGYFARVLRDNKFMATIAVNLDGTEWRDGLIPENLHGIDLREPDDTQLSLFGEE